MLRSIALTLFVISAVNFCFGAPPSTASTNLVFSNVSSNQMTLSWTNGDGAMRIVVARAGSAVDANPVDGIDYSSYQSLASGQLVVYKGTGNTFDFKSDGNGPLDEGVEYHFEIFEYNGSGTSTEYLTASSLTGSKIAQVSTLEPTIGASSISFSNIGGNTADIQWTNGNGTNRVVIAKQGSPISATLSDGSTYSLYQSLSDGSKIIYNGTGTTKSFGTLGNGPLTVNTTYYISVIEYNGSGINTNYANSLASINNFTTSSVASEPTVQVSNVISSFKTDTPSLRIDLDWTKGDGTNTLVIFREGTPIDPGVLPVDGTDYPLWNEIAAGHKVCYKGTGSHLEFKSDGLGDLNPNSTYYFALFTFNGSDVTANYLTTSPATFDETTVSSGPGTPPSNLFFDQVDGNSMRVNWTSGDGDGRIVIAKSGSAVDYLNYDLPADGTTYTVNQNLGGGNYVAYVGSSNNFTFSSLGGPGLSLGTTYHFAVIEYSGSGNSINYLNEQSSHVLIGSQATDSQAAEPTVASSGLVFSNISNTSMTLTWTSGNGAKRIVVARENAAITAVPSDGTEYTQYQSITSGNIVVYVGSGNTLVFNNDGGGPLTPGATYYFEIFEYNGTEATTNYLTSATLTGNEIATSGNAEPTVAATNLIFTGVQETEMTLNWTNGDGAQRIIISRENAPVDVSPVDGIDYASFQSLAVGQKVVYEGSGSSFRFATNGNGPLTAGITYHFAIFEFNGTGSNTNYLVSPNLTGSQITLALAAEPTVPSSNLIFSNVKTDEMTLSWTSGNGAQRIIVTREGSPVSVLPSDGTDYSVYQSLSSGQKVIYKGTGSSFTFKTNGNGPLTPNTTYYFAIFELNGSSSNVNYLTSSYLTGSQTTASAGTLAPPPPSGISARISISNLITNNDVNTQSASEKTTSYADKSELKGSELLDNNEIQVKMYPNPVENKMYIDLSGVDTDDLIQIMIYNSSGRLIQGFSINDISTIIDFESMPKGYYYIKIQQSDFIHSERIVVR